ncbi:succinate dehydrogenase cytochrome b subunit [Phytohabitans flavus]|uniref:Succinate dehydrogenase n=1 Tax=Phytohabitans flavus TaxID=1076124 RepID=A0A6F8XNV0_9ACTN|nr:succinate dehydrogenase [Phytohabitans flavus]
MESSGPSVGDVVTVSAVRSTVGQKTLMAVSGILLVLFLVAHMIGNLKVFVGAGSFDHYAHWLRAIGAPLLPHSGYLWIQRAVLTAALVAHVWAATALALRARAARPVGYAHRRPVQGSYAARTMRWGGVIILLFAIYHVLDLTTGHLNPVGDRAHPYGNVVADFAPERWYVTLFYTLAVLAVGFHLRHGLFSAVRTLGQRTAAGEQRARLVALLASVGLCAGYLSVPFAVMVGLVG